MEIRVVREKKTDRYTLGSLYIGKAFFCYTCEDAERGEADPATVDQWKIPKETCIPKTKPGKPYRVIVDFSGRFQKHLPHVLDVPGFKGVRIHSGNTDKDTEGCILVGITPLESGVGNSRATMRKLLPKIQEALLGGEIVTLSIE